MRTLKLARIAAEAEGLRLRRMARRRGIQVAEGVVAITFLCFGLMAAHFAGFLALLRWVAPVAAALIVLGVDLLLTLIFGWLATRSTPSRIEQEAFQVREQAKQQLAIATATATTLVPAARSLGLKHLSGLVIGALATRYLTRQ